MKKAILIILAITVLLVLVIALYTDSIIKVGVNRELPKLLGVPASVGSVHIAFTSGTVALSDITVGAPSGIDSIPYTFKLDKISLIMPIADLLYVNDRATIDLIAIQSPELYYALTKHGSNIQAILKHLQAQSAPQAAAPKTVTSPKKPPYKVAIKRLVVMNIKANLVAYGSKPIQTSIGRIELHNIGTVSHKATISSAIEQVLHALLSKLSQQDVTKLLQKAGADKLKQQIQEHTKGVGSKGAKDLKKLFSH